MEEGSGGQEETLTNDGECPVPPLTPPTSYLPLLSPTDQQGLGSGGFSGGQRCISPGSVALRALHRFRNHNVRLRHRCVDFLPVRQTPLRPTHSQEYTHKKKMYTRHGHNISPLYVI